MARDDIRPARIDQHRFGDDGKIPNNPRLPLLIYRGTLLPGRDADRDLAAAFESVFAENGWRGAWRDGIYPYHHYHSTAHEVLGVASGEAQVRLGGRNGTTLTIRTGDVVIIPAGVGHRSMGATPDFLVVGAYPDGRDWDLCTGEPGERPGVLENIERVPMPGADPVLGPDGPLIDRWRHPDAAKR